MPEDELTFSSELVNHRGRVAGLLRTESAPEFPAGVLVEGDGDAAFATDEADQLVGVHERMPGETPQRRFRPKVLFEIMRPDDCAFFSVETGEISLRAEGIDLPVLNR